MTTFETVSASEPDEAGKGGDAAIPMSKIAGSIARTMPGAMQGGVQ